MATESDDDRKGLSELLDVLRDPKSLQNLWKIVGGVYKDGPNRAGGMAATLQNFRDHEDLTVFSRFPSMLDGQPLVNLLRASLATIIRHAKDRLVHDPDLDQADMVEAERLLAILGSS